MSKFDLYQDGKYVGFGNPNMLRTYTDEEIKKFYERFNVEVVIKRDVK
jgi:hypothetical protein